MAKTYTKDEAFELLGTSPATRQAKLWLSELEEKRPGYPRALLELLSAKLQLQKKYPHGGPDFEMLATLLSIAGVSLAAHFKVEDDEVIADLEKLDELAREGSTVLREAGITQENAEAIHREARAEKEMMDALAKAAGNSVH